MLKVKYTALCSRSAKNNINSKIKMEKSFYSKKLFKNVSYFHFKC